MFLQSPPPTTFNCQAQPLRNPLLGQIFIKKDAWRLKKAAALLKVLPYAPGNRLHREQVMEMLWPELGRKTASNNLRYTLHAARKILDPAAGSRYLASEGE